MILVLAARGDCLSVDPGFWSTWRPFQSGTHVRVAHIDHLSVLRKKMLSVLGLESHTSFEDFTSSSPFTARVKIRFHDLFERRSKEKQFCGNKCYSGNTVTTAPMVLGIH